MFLCDFVFVFLINVSTFARIRKNRRRGVRVGFRFFVSLFFGKVYDLVQPNKKLLQFGAILIGMKGLYITLENDFCLLG